jgi:Ribbon-helix-helix protein, copG family
MAKGKMTVTIDVTVLADVDADARATGLNRSEYVERTLRDAHYRRLLAVATPVPMRPEQDRELQVLLDWQRDPGKPLDQRHDPGDAA